MVDKRPSAHERGYGHRWRKLRAWKLARDPVCEILEKCHGDAATEVDHIEPSGKGGELYDPDNLQSTCHNCHVWKTRTIDYPRKGFLSEYQINEIKNKRKLQGNIPGSVGMQLVSKFLKN